MRKRSLLWTAVLLVVSLCFAGAAAAGTVVTVVEEAVPVKKAAPGVPAAEPEGELMLATPEDAIERASELFPAVVQSKEKELEVHFSDSRYEGRRMWHVSYHPHRPGPDYGYFSVSLAADTGELFGYNYRPEPGALEGKKRVVTRAEALQIARAFARKYQSERLAKMQLDADYNRHRYGEALDLSYGFRWHQVIDGVPFNDNSIYVRVDAVSGQVTDFRCTWREDGELPEQGAKMDAAAFTSRVVEKLGLYPCYVVDPETERTGLPDAILVYRLNTPYHQFDAVTGKALGPGGNIVDWADARKYDRDFTPVPAPERATGYDQLQEHLSPVQVQKIAAAFFKKLGLEGRVERSGGGSSVGPGYREEYWSYRLVREKPYEHREVSINARTGEVRSYHSEIDRGKQDRKGEGISLQEAQQAAREFLKLVRLDNLDEMVLQQEPENWKLEMAYPEGPPEYNFTYVRLVNGIPYEQSTVSVSVDRFTGKVVRFYSHERPVKTFEATAGVLPEAKAVEAFKEYQPFTLGYERMHDWENETEKVVLAYCLDYGYGIDAHTGEEVKRDGTKKETLSYNTKLQSHWARIPLTLLADSGLLPPPEEFNPNGTVNRRDGLRVLAAAMMRYYYPEGPTKSPFQDVADNDKDLMAIKLAVDRGVIKAGGKLRPDAPLTREDLAVWLVNALGYKKIATAPIDMAVNFKDASKIGEGKKNAVAIASGLNYMNGDQTGSFRPRDPVTWAELASVIVRAAPDLNWRY
ncbi:MAG: S-layer homology domain-containing protein [Peptococcaceae bacterium]|nr:S-layer homology domain-containing protein [Peptococcaceae bacterium]